MSRTTSKKAPKAPQKKEEKAGPGFPPLYVRYNGMMLGFFLAGAFAQATAARYPILRERMLEFLDELGAKVELPQNHTEFVENHADVSLTVLKAVLERNQEVGEFALMSSLAIHYTIAAAGKNPEAAEMREQAEYLAEKHGIPTKQITAFKRAVKARKDGSISLHKIHSASLAFLREAIRPLEFQKEAALVAMPFSPEFRVRFPNLYAPVLREFGYRAIRAWGGIESEDYQELLFDLISKCGCVLGELTTNNPNVLHEVGLAQGQDETLLLLCGEKGKVNVPANLGHLAVFRYDLKDENWEMARLELSAGIALGMLGLEIEKNPEQFKKARSKTKSASKQKEAPKIPKAGSRRSARPTVEGTKGRARP